MKWAVLVGACGILVGCPSVQATQDSTIECEQTPQAFCASEPGGCPTPPGRIEDFCAWAPRRGLTSPSLGGALFCDTPRSSGLSVDLGGRERWYLFDAAGLVLVLERDDRGQQRCLAGSPHQRVVGCSDNLVGYGCADDAGTDGP